MTNELALDLADALEETVGSSMRRVTIYDPEVGPGEVEPGHGPAVYLPEMDELLGADAPGVYLPGADSNGE